MYDVEVAEYVSCRLLITSRYVLQWNITNFDGNRGEVISYTVDTYWIDTINLLIIIINAYYILSRKKRQFSG